MRQIVGITEFRNQLSRLAEQVVRTGEPLVVIRESRPELVVTSYKVYQEREKELLKNKALALLNQGQSAFRGYLKRKGIDPEELSDEEAEKLLEEL